MVDKTKEEIICLPEYSEWYENFMNIFQKLKEMRGYKQFSIQLIIECLHIY